MAQIPEDDYEHTLPVSDDEDEKPYNDLLIYPGLVLKGDYILLKVIGYGNNARVWIAYQISSKSFIAMKIQDFQGYRDGCREVAIVKKINAYADLHKFKDTNCIKLLDFFVYEAMEDIRFVCSIYYLYADSLILVLENGKYKYGLPIHVVKSITRQLLNACSILHNDLKIIHTDIRPANILFKGTSEIQSQVMQLFIRSGFQEKYDKLCLNQKDKKRFKTDLEILAVESVSAICALEKSKRQRHSSPSRAIQEEDDLVEGEDDDNCLNSREQSVEDLIEYIDQYEMHDLEAGGDYDFDSVLNNRANGTTTDTREMIDENCIYNCQIVLTDFGNSYFSNNRTKNEIQDRLYRAPEIILDLNYGYSCDMWSIGCLVFELLTGFPLFAPEYDPLNADLQHLYLLEKTLGPMPIALKKKSKRCRFLFDKKRNYHIKNVKEFVQVPLKDRLTKQFLFSESDAREIAAFLLCVLRYDPNQRVTAKNLLNHSWLK